MGTFTDPGVLFTVPWHDTWRVHTGNPISRSSVVSRTPASMTSPRTPRAISDDASSSPNIPCVEGAVVVTTSTSPGQQTSTAAWIMMLSPGWLSTVTADPAILIPCWIGRSSGPRYPMRPIASWTVAVPASRKPSIVCGPARSISRTTTCGRELTAHRPIAAG